MATEEKILLDVQIKSGDALKRVAEIGLRTKELADEQKKLTKEYAAGKLSVDQYTSAVAKLDAETRLLSKEKADLNNLVKNEIKQTTSLEGSYNALSAEYSLNVQKLNAMSEAQRQGTEEGKKLELETNAIREVMKKLKEATGDHTLSVGDYSKALKGENVVLLENIQHLKTQHNDISRVLQPTKEQENQIKMISAQLEQQNAKYQQNDAIIKKVEASMGFLTTKEEKMGDVNISLGNTIEGMKARLVELDKVLNTTDVGSKKFKDASDEAQKLRLKIDQTLGKVDEFGAKEAKNPVKKGFEDSADAAAGVIASIQLVEIAFGKNNSTAEAQARILKLVAIQQAVVNVAKSVGAIKDLASAAATWVNVAAQKAYALVVGKSTGAMKLFRIALAGTGVGLLVIALGELIFNFEAVNKKINQAINWFDEFTEKLSGGSKTVKAAITALTVVLLGPIVPIITLIRLINDFGGTVGKLQNFINRIIDEIAGFTDRLGFLGEQVRMMQKTFNFLIDSIKSLDGGTKKYKVNLEDLNKMYDSFNDNLDKNNTKLKQQIDILNSTGKSEREVANLTREMLQNTTKERQKALDHAITISNKLIKQNGKLTDDQQKIFDKVQGDYNQAVTDQIIFENEMRKEQNEKAKERAQDRLDQERSLQHELIELRNGFIKDEFDKQRADLAEQFRVDKENNDLEIQESIKKFGEKSKIVTDLREKEKLLTQKFNEETFAIDVAQADKETDLLLQTIETQDQIRKESYAFRSEALATQLKQEDDFLQASFVNTGENERDKLNQQLQLQQQRLELQKKFLQDQLALTKEFALTDGFLADEEIEQINKLATAIANLDSQITEVKDAKIVNLLGLTQSDLDQIQFGADQVLSVLDTINQVVNANAQNQIRAIDDTYKFELAKIEQSTASQEEKEEKIQALNKKTADKKYQIELEQFRANKATSIIQATIAGVLAVISALNNPIPFAGIVQAAIIGATTAAQIGIIAAQPEPPKPSYAGGVIGLDGPGSETSDSISANLSKGESVMTAKATKAFHRELAMMEKAVGNNPNYQFTGKFAGGFIGDGGFTSRSINGDVEANLNSNVIAARLASVMSRVKIVTKVSDINKVQGEVLSNQVESRIG